MICDFVDASLLLLLCRQRVGRGGHLLLGLCLGRLVLRGSRSVGLVSFVVVMRGELCVLVGRSLLGRLLLLERA